MNVNLPLLSAFIKKATISGSIDSLHINFSKDRVKSKMRSTYSISILDMENQIFYDFGNDIGEYDLYFTDPKISITPYINLLPDEVSISLNENYIGLDGGNIKTKLFMCHPNIVSVFNHSEPSEGLSYFVKETLDNRFSNSFKSLKEIMSKFGKVYIGVDSGKLYMEASDKTNATSNSSRLDLWDLENPYQDLYLCFEYKPFLNLMSTLDSNVDYTLECSYVEEQQLGMLAFRSPNESYFILSKSE